MEKEEEELEERGKWMFNKPYLDFFGGTSSIRAVTVEHLQNLAFSNSKHYFIYFNNILYNTPYNKCFIIFSTLK